MYHEIVEDCKRHGNFDVATMGNVANVGLMAQKAEEYGSHPTTFEVASAGTVRVVNNDTNEVVFEHSVGSGDIWRMCQTKVRKPRYRAPKSSLSLSLSRVIFFRIKGCVCVLIFAFSRSPPPHDLPLPCRLFCWVCRTRR